MNPAPDDYVNPFAGLDRLVPPRKRRVVPPSSVKVADARLAFCEAKRAAVEHCGGCCCRYQYDVVDALHAWLRAEREERAE